VGDAFELLVKHYLLNDPVYKTILKEVWLLKEVPNDARLYINLPSSDQGIDIVAKTHNNEFWAIQCKYRSDETRSLTWKEISTFTGLSFGICKNISFGLICTTGEKYPKVFKGQDRISFCTSQIWRNLDPSFFKELSRGKSVPRSPLTPYVHQKRAIKLANEHFVGGSSQRGKLIMPCGTGKSLTSYWISENLSAKSILVVVPSLSLLRQTIKVWTNELVATSKASDTEWLCVCSDDSVTDADDYSILTHDLGVPCVTDKKSIGDWLTKPNSEKTRIVFTTYQSGKRLAEASQVAGAVYDLAVFDEAHKTTGKANALFSWLLYDQNISIKNRLFMTATERYYKGKSDQVVSMEDTSLYGETFMHMTFGEAQKQEPQIICDYKVLTLYVTRNETRDLVTKNEFVRPSNMNWEDEVTASMLASLIALKKVMRQYPVRHSVSYHSSIAKAKVFKENADVFTELFPEYGSLDTYHIRGSDPASMRDRIMTDFAKSEKSLVTNSRCLIEGIDMPEIDCVLFADPKRSTTDIVQALGRALRPSKHKEFGYIVIPVIIDDLQALEGLLETSSFVDMFSILRALAANDERIIDYFRSITHDSVSNNGLLSDAHTLTTLTKTVDVEEFIGAVNLLCWDNLTKLAYWSYDRANRYVKRLGLVSEEEWYYYCDNKLMGLTEKPVSIPLNPQEVYGEQWTGWESWLGIKNNRSFSRYFHFGASKQFVKTLNLSNQSEWRRYKDKELKGFPPKPHHVPANPELIYKNEWVNWQDWLGEKGHLPYAQAKVFVRKLRLNSSSEWEVYCQGARHDLPEIPFNIPRRPRVAYGKDWIDWQDWLGIYLPFEQARAFARQQKFWSTGKWKRYVKGELVDTKKIPAYIPKDPPRVYGDAWVSWADWLRGSTYLTFKEARSYVHRLNFKSKIEWDNYVRGKRDNLQRAFFLPHSPQHVYLNEWVDWNNWIGWDDLRKDIRYQSFEKARAFARSLDLHSTSAWRRYCNGEYPNLPKKPENIPINPSTIYHNKWKGIQDWLTDNNTQSIPFNLARSFVRSVGLKNRQEWEAYVAKQISPGKPLPKEIPLHPDSVYKEEWINWQDWLGSDAS
jgi:superfamily II DNA or RNA helicase